MGIAAIVPGPNRSTRMIEHRRSPYLLQTVIATQPNHRWGSASTSIRLRNGWRSLVVVLDWFSRSVVRWALDDTICNERFWRALNDEEVSLADHDSPREARQAIARSMQCYNTERPHQALANRHPFDWYTLVMRGQYDVPNDTPERAHGGRIIALLTPERAAIIVHIAAGINAERPLLPGGAVAHDTTQEKD